MRDGAAADERAHGLRLRQDRFAVDRAQCGAGERPDRARGSEQAGMAGGAAEGPAVLVVHFAASAAGRARDPLQSARIDCASFVGD